MTNGTHIETDGRLQFAARLLPNRSLSKTGFLIFMCLTSVVSFAAGVFFLWLGAWPVFGFFGLDLALIYLAFRWNYWTGRETEHVWITDHTLYIERISPGGTVQTWDFNAAWVSVELQEPTARRSSLLLTYAGKQLEIAAFLPTEEKRSFVGALSKALAAHRA